jgi:prolipoprotein diacylglyceryltransferase
VLRFGIEFTRGDYNVHYLGIFTSAQIFSVFLVLIAVTGLARSPKSETARREDRANSSEK